MAFTQSKAYAEPWCAEKLWPLRREGPLRPAVLPDPDARRTDADLASQAAMFVDPGL